VSFCFSFTTCPFQSMRVLHTIFPMLVSFSKTSTPCCHYKSINQSINQPTETKQMSCVTKSVYYTQTLKPWRPPNPPRDRFRCFNTQIQLPHADGIINSWKHGNLRYLPLMRSKLDHGSEFKLIQCLSVATRLLVPTRRRWDIGVSTVIPEYYAQKNSITQSITIPVILQKTKTSSSR